MIRSTRKRASEEHLPAGRVRHASSGAGPEARRRVRRIEVVELLFPLLDVVWLLVWHRARLNTEQVAVRRVLHRFHDRLPRASLKGWRSSSMLPCPRIDLNGLRFRGFIRLATRREEVGPL
jgi:hypothetical protein